MLSCNIFKGTSTNTSYMYFIETLNDQHYYPIWLTFTKWCLIMSLADIFTIMSHKNCNVTSRVYSNPSRIPSFLESPETRWLIDMKANDKVGIYCCAYSDGGSCYQSLQIFVLSILETNFSVLSSKLYLQLLIFLILF